MNAHLERAVALIEQSRYALAEEELRQSLAEDPDNGVAHAFYALCLGKREVFDQAATEAETAVALAPESAFTHYIQAQVFLDQHRWKEAAKAITEAIRLDPSDADSRAILGMVRVEQREWLAALAAADEGLRLDAGHVGCANIRAMVLVKLGRRDEAGQTIGAALSTDPENALTHANQGWALLHAGKRKQAMEHFQEALRLAPDLEWARAGIVEGLKARNPLYGLILRYFLFKFRLQPGARFAILVGTLLIYYGLVALAEAYPNLAPFLWSILAVYITFALVTLFGSPFFNLLLRFHPTGKHALSRLQRLQSNCTAVLLLPAVIALVWWLVTDDDLAFVIAIVLGFTLMSLLFTFTLSDARARRVMIIYSSVLALVGLVCVLLTAFKVNGVVYVLYVFMGGAVLSTLITLGLKYRLARR